MYNINKLICEAKLIHKLESKSEKISKDHSSDIKDLFLSTFHDLIENSDFKEKTQPVYMIHLYNAAFALYFKNSNIVIHHDYYTSILSPDIDLTKLVDSICKAMEEKLEIKELARSLVDAAYQCDIEKLKLLLDHKYAILILNGIASNSSSDTPLMLAALGPKDAPNGKSYEAVQLLIKHGANILAQSKDQRTALMNAAIRGRSSVVDLLLDNLSITQQISYINMKDDIGYTAQTWAEKQGHEDVAKNLLNRAKSAEDNLGKTATLTVNVPL